MKRRDFLKSVSGLAARRPWCRRPAIWSAAKADARSGDIADRLGRAVPTISGHPRHRHQRARLRGLSWNCYDRLISHEMKKRSRPACRITNRDKFKPELGRKNMNVGDMVGDFLN